MKIWNVPAFRIVLHDTVFPINKEYKRLKLHTSICTFVHLNI